MASKSLEEIFREAAQLAKSVPENLQEAAFNRAVEQLLPSSSSSPRQPLPPPRGNRQRVVKPKKPEHDQDHSALELINRTQHADIGVTKRVADRALKVLQLANDDYGVDGLTAPEIAEILTKKFRLPVKGNAVSMALSREISTVDVRKGLGGSRVFHIMAPGEDYLRMLRAGDAPRKAKSSNHQKMASAPRQKHRRIVPNAISETENGADRKAKKNTQRMSKAAGRPGPKAAVKLLIDSGFFRAPRVISQIQDELKHRRGNSYSLQELSPALVRLLRDGNLDRERNAEGQYEYSQA